MTTLNPWKGFIMVDIEKFLTTKGQFVRVAWESEKKPASEHKNVKLVKKSSGVFRAGINFSKLGSVIDGIRDGERGEVQKLPWGKWKQFPYIIEHKDTEYVRLYPPGDTITNDDGTTKRVSDWGRAKMEVEYFVDGKPVDKKTFNGYLTPSEANKDGDLPDCFTVKRSNLTSLCDNK